MGLGKMRTESRPGLPPRPLLGDPSLPPSHGLSFLLSRDHLVRHQFPELVKTQVLQTLALQHSFPEVKSGIGIVLNFE